MTNLREAAQNVVDVWKLYGTAESLRGWMEILETALAAGDKLSPGEPVQEPVTRLFGTLPVYDIPPQRKPLTDEVIADLWHQNGGFHHHFARAIERWLRDHA